MNSHLVAHASFMVYPLLGPYPQTPTVKKLATVIWFFYSIVQFQYTWIVFSEFLTHAHGKNFVNCNTVLMFSSFFSLVLHLIDAIHFQSYLDWHLLPSCQWSCFIHLQNGYTHLSSLQCSLWYLRFVCQVWILPWDISTS